MATKIVCDFCGKACEVGQKTFSGLSTLVETKPKITVEVVVKTQRGDEEVCVKCAKKAIRKANFDEAVLGMSKEG